MPSWAIALFLKPFIAVVFFLFLRLCVVAFTRFAPDSKLKRMLLLPIRRKSRNG